MITSLLATPHMSHLVTSTPQGIRLPRRLREELAGEAGERSHPKRTSRTSRKDARRGERKQRKQNKADFFSSGAHSFKRYADDTEHMEAPKHKKIRLVPPDTSSTKSENDRKSSSTPSTTKAAKSRTSMKLDPTALEKLRNPADPSLPPAPSERSEDTYITYLERKLGWTTGSAKLARYGAGFEDDGLDELLTGLDTFDTVFEKTPEVEGDIEAADDGSKYEIHVPNDDIHDADRHLTEFYETSDVESWHGFEPSAGDMLATNPSAELPRNISSPNEHISSAYVPPHLRAPTIKGAQAVEELSKLTRQLKGQLNRLSEQNIAFIINSMEDIYRKHRRHDVTSSLTRLIIDGIASHSILLDSYVVLHAAFVSSLHRIIGNEFAAYFTQTVVSCYERYYSEIFDQSTESPDDATKGKECSNLIVLLSELYNFQVISCILIYNVVRDLLDKELSEWTVELLLKVVRNSGQQLRQDDPAALKDIIGLVQAKLSCQSEVLSSRTRFMLETLTNLKNNKIKQSATPGGVEIVERLRKFISGLSKKRQSHEPLRITLDDLHASESKGKWWLVGAAWNGNPLVDRSDGITQELRDDNSDSLIKLARKQGMNTDIRRSIFVVLMSSEDYLDACERLSQLNLSEVQQREIVRVVLHCCGKEKVYNPFYTLVCQQLCRTSHSYKITLQFCLWDFLREIGETNVGGAVIIKGIKEGSETFDKKIHSNSKMRNVAMAYAWWIAKDCITLAILKPVDFTVLQPQSRLFFKLFFRQLFISSQISNPAAQANLSDLPSSRNQEAVEQIFIKATRIESLALGLLYFLSETFPDDDREDSGAKVLKWGIAIAKDALRNGMDAAPDL